MSGNNRKCVVKESDYETYWINIPFRCFLGKQKNKYLYGELEKRHPCFSDDYFFCSKIFLKNRKLKSKVFVMEKMKIAEYKLQNPKCYFVTEDKRKLPLFYQSLGVKKLWILILLIFLFVFFSLFLILKSQHLHNLEDVVVEETEKVSEEEIRITDDFNFALNDECECLFKIMTSNKSSIKTFLWEYSNYFERFEVFVGSVYPEYVLDSLPSSKISNVNYYENKPSFNLSYEKKNIIKGLQIKNQNECNETIKNVRNLLLKNKCELIEETFYPRAFRFILTVNKNAIDSFENENVFLDLGDFFYEEKILLESFNVNSKKNEDDSILLEVSIGWANYRIGDSIHVSKVENTSKNICEFVGKHIELFFAEIKQDEQKTKKTNFRILEDKTIGLQKREELKKSNLLKNKIGEIKNKDGSITIFYKSTNNKILKEVIDEK